MARRKSSQIRKKKKTTQKKADSAPNAGSKSASDQPSPTAENQPTRNEWLALGAILLVGLILRASYLLEIVDAPDFDHPQLDPAHYDYWARGLVTGDWTPPPGQPDPLVTSTPFVRPPGYPYFLALVYLVTDSSYLGIRVVQMALGLANCVLMFVLARALFGRAVGLVAAAFMSFYWAFIYFEGELNAPAFTVFLLLAIMNILRLWLTKITFARAFAAGVLLGVFATIRPEALLFIPVLFVWTWWILRPSMQWRRLLLACVAVVAGIGLLITPVAIRNYVAGHEFVLICTSGGLNLYADNNELADGAWPQMDLKSSLGIGREWTNFDMPLFVKALERKLGRDDVTHTDVSNYFSKLAWDYIRKNPVRTLGLVAKKAALFWGPAEISNNKVVYYEKKNSLTLRYMPGFPIAAGMFVTGLLLLFLEAGASRRQEHTVPRIQMAVLFLLYVGITFASILPFHVAARYRVRVIPFLLLFGAYAVCRLAAFVKARDYGKVAVWGTLGCGLCALFSVPFVPYEYDLAQWHHDRGQAHRDNGDRESALEEFRKAVEAGGDSPRHHANLALELNNQGELDGSIRHYGRAVQLNPHFALAHNNLGRALYDQGKLDAAIEHYRIAVEEDFLLTIARLNLGIALLDQEQLDDAIARFAEVLESDPANRYADYHWARALDMQGNPREALQHYVSALKLNPDSPGIHNKLALLLEDEGKRRQAVRYYRRAIELDPRFAPAHFNLAVALARRGEFQEAADIYEVGLQVAPEDDDTPRSLAALLEELGEHELAVKLCEATGQSAPDIAQSLIDLANQLVSQGKVIEAIDHYLEALEIDPANRDAYFNLGVVTAAQGKAEEAARYYAKALELDPTDADIANRLGLLLARQGKFDEAIRYYETAVQNDPRSTNVRNNLGNALAAQGKLEEALEQYRAALEIDPDDEAAHYNQARALTGLERIDEAIESYSKVLEADPNAAVVHTRIAQLLAQQGKLKEAIKHYETALGIDPNDETARENLDRALAQKGGD